MQKLEKIADFLSGTTVLCLVARLFFNLNSQEVAINLIVCGAVLIFGTIVKNQLGKTLNSEIKYQGLNFLVLILLMFIR